MKSVDKLWIFLMELGKLTGCHQKPERSVYIKGYQFPVCARCTGIIIAKPVAWIYVKRKKLSWIKCIILVIPMVIDGVIQYRFAIESNNKRRLLTGFLGGFAINTMKIQVMKRIFRENDSNGRNNPV